ncbi:hypothetical protein CGSMWGv1400E_00245 [Gardnerella vaginalis 1400E]|uniref:Uncharacterized protein n=1 Tax=Gardnerella vaginalis 1400E TaxID=698956 RepID=I4LZ77_GARVA|nr:hypothetical protein CGSMWGv1400E_00245 [Gardnerella vaginalis 1400E]
MVPVAIKCKIAAIGYFGIGCFAIVGFMVLCKRKTMRS